MVQEKKICQPILEFQSCNYNFFLHNHKGTVKILEGIN